MSGTSADQVYGFDYNPASQLVTRTSTNDSYASNTAYNVSRSYSVNGLNQYTAAGPAGFTYDANGNLTSDGSTSYVYDAENRLVSASGAHAATLSYDPAGRLWQVASASGTTRFVYDGDKLIQEYDGGNNLLRFYRHGPGADEPIMWFEWVPGVGWDRRFFHADHQGSIVAVTDSLSNPVYVNGYDAWGIPNAGDSWDRAAVATRGRFGYTGQAWLPELGMWYYKARIYSPTLGRFLQTDPVGYEGGMDLYAYVGNDPVNHDDPTGLKPDNTPEGCGTRIRGQSTAGCYTYGGKSGPSAGKRTFLFIPKINSPGGRAVTEILRDKEVVAALNEAWKRSKGDSRSAREKNEYGFWVQKVGNRYIVGVLVQGIGPLIPRTYIDRAHADLPGANIFIHVHPFRTGEVEGVEGIGLTNLDRGLGLDLTSLVISVARPEPYNGRNVYADYADEFWGHR